MPPPPSLSVIVNNYNYAPFLARAIESALAQSGPSFEVVVVDDGSTDGSRALIAGFGERIVPVLQDNAGQAAAINAGVRASRGRILCFLDADDWFDPGKLAAVARAFEAEPGAGLVFHRLQPTFSDGRIAFRAIPRSLCRGDLAPLLGRSGGVWPVPMTSAIAVRRRVWNRAGEIPERFRISADAWITGVHPFLTRVIALPEVLGGYRIHANNWYRAVPDAAVLRKRIAHWEAVAEVTNDFLCREELPWRIDLRDHHPYRVAHAQLQGAAPTGRAALLLRGLCDPSEPNLLRRARDAVQAARRVGGRGLIDDPPVPAQ